MCSSRDLTVQNLVWDFETDDSLVDSAEIVPHLQAGLAPSIGPTLVQLLDSVPNLVLNEGVLSSLEESFEWELENGVEQVTETRQGVSSDVELGGLGLDLAGHLGIAELDEGVGGIVVWLHEVLSNGQDRIDKDDGLLNQ